MATVVNKNNIIIKIILIITRSIIESDITKSLHRHYKRFREKITKEMGRQTFPKNRH